MARSELAGPRTVQQVADALIERIAEGRWTKAIPLPNLDVLAVELRTTGDVLSAALAQLTAEKLISQRGGGQFTVTDVQAQALSVRFSNLVTQEGVRVAGEAIDASMEVAEANAVEAAHLRIEPGSPVCRIHRTRGRDGHRFMFEIATLPTAIFPGLMESTGIPFRTPVLCRRYGLTVRHAEEHVSLGSANADVAVALGVGYGTPLFVLERVLYAADGTPIEFRIGQTLMTDLKYVTKWGAAQALE